MESYYSNYLNKITDILDRKPGLKPFFAKEGLKEAVNNVDVRESKDSALVSAEQKQLTELFGEPIGYKLAPTIGTHPNFKNMELGEKCYQYCVSMFIDIKGSTDLSVNYNLEQVRMMKDTILSICIQTVTIFGGHVQRLQGDGLYVQFTDLSVHQNNMMINALNAASVLCLFVSTTLASLFVQRNLKPLRIKVGIDFAEKEKCLWSHYGLPGCNELTATSLHVDLAAKLQARCDSNEIRIGQYVKQLLDLPSEFIRVPINSNNREDTYIKTSVNYRQYIFDWQAYLLMFDFIHKKKDNGIEIESPEFSLSCYFTNDLEKEVQYFQNNGAIPKQYRLKFILMKNGKPYSKLPQSDIINWRIVNRGDEATEANELEEELNHYNGRTQIEVGTAYLGHHYMECVLERPCEKFSRRVKFGVYVR